MIHITILDIYFMENAMNSDKKAWISTYQEQVKRISSMNSWYEIMGFFMNSCCVWISTYQEQVKHTSSHEFIPIHHGMNSWCDMNSWYEIMVLGYYFKPLLWNGLFMVWFNTLKFWMKFNSWCDGMNSYNEIYVLNSHMKYMYGLIILN